MVPTSEFHNLYRHGFARVAVCVPEVRIAQPQHNAQATLELLAQAAGQGAALALFPELGLSAYTCDDLFHQRALLDACEQALATVIEGSRAHAVLAVVGLPLRVQQRLYNCAAVVHMGRLLGVVPKSYLPNYAEFYEARQFNAAATASAREVTLAGQTVPFGADLLFQAEGCSDFTLHVEICEDLWVPVPPSSYAAMAGATVLANLSASNVTIGKAEYRRTLVASHSARCVAAYLYGSAGEGESTNDLAWDGHALICENGECLAETERYAGGSQLITADIDLERLQHERMRQGSWVQCAQAHAERLAVMRRVVFEPRWSLRGPMPLQRSVARFPYVPSNPAQRDARCAEVFHMQVQALVQRLRASGQQRLVIGISGGLDSTHALLVCARVMDRMGLPRSRILGVTMPGFATSERTLGQALALMAAVGCEAQTIDIRPSCLQMLRDIGHPAGQGEAVYDVTYENVQAGERTSHLFRLANRHGALVVGTGDLSELALGWCTYGVGDHMSHYGVNASVPKTLMQYLVRWVADQGTLGAEGSRTLRAILDTEISPELVPGHAGGQPAQASEATVGPYELQDFHLYQVLRYGHRPSKVAFLAHHAWGSGPDARYTLAEIKAHLRTFLDRFFRTSQFKRTCVPNSPKVGSGGSLSPRGDWRAPSDADSALWLRELDEGVPDA
ncbi:MAG: NAD(+) synthase [Burkholderiaceae bacterium]|nr:NAD(+) synthase [Burkholderiaceae bacterium]